MRRPKLLVTASPRHLERAIEEIGSMMYPYDPYTSIKLCENAPRFMVITSASLRYFYRELAYAPPAYANRIVPIMYVIGLEDIVKRVSELLEKVVSVYGQDNIKVYVSMDDRIPSQLRNDVRALVSKFRCSGSCFRISFEIIYCGNSIVVGSYPYGFDRVSWFRSGRADVRIMTKFLSSLGVN